MTYSFFNFFDKNKRDKNERDKNKRGVKVFNVNALTALYFIFLVFAFIGMSTYSLTDLQAKSSQNLKSSDISSDKKSSNSFKIRNNAESSKNEDSISKSFRKWQKMMAQSEGNKKSQDSKSMMKSMEGSASMNMSQSSNSEGVERLEVIGSRIKRTDIEGASPITILDRQALELGGKASLADVLRDEVSILSGVRASFTLSPDTIGRSFGGEGIRNQKTLVLINGRRIVTKPGTSYVDLSVIPISAIERIEILKAASSIYGSDSVGGVINIVTRKDAGNGIYVSHKQPFELGGLSSEVNLMLGHKGERYSVSSVFQYSYMDSIHSEDRNFYHPGFSSNGGNPGAIMYEGYLNKDVDGQGRGGQYVARGEGEPVRYFITSKNCGEGQNTGSDFPRLKDDKTKKADGKPDPSYKVGNCRYEYTKDMEQVPEFHVFGGLVNFELDLDSIKVTSGVVAQRRTSTYYLAANPINTFHFPELFPDSFMRELEGVYSWYTRNITEYRQRPTDEPDHTAVGFSRRFTEWGRRKNKLIVDSINTWLGVEGSWLVDWDWKASLGYGYTRDNFDASNYAEANKFKDQVKRGNYDPGYDLTSEQREKNRQALGKFMVDIFKKEKTHLVVFETFTSGKIIDLPYGPLSTSLGGEVNFQNYDIKVDEASKDGRILLGDASYGGNERTIYSLFAEGNTVIIPNLETSVSVRFDDYSDFGSTLNPRADFRYQALPNLLFRGNVGTSFVAPDLGFLFGNKIDYEGLQDKVACPYEDDRVAEEACNKDEEGTLQYLTRFKPNPDLEEEKVLNLSFGSVIEGDVGDLNFYFGSDLWAFWRKNVIGFIDSTDLTELEAEKNKKVPDSGREYLRSLGQDIERSDTATVKGFRQVTTITKKPRNLNDRQTYGFDLFSGLRLPSYNGYKFSIDLDFAYILLDKSAATQDLKGKDYIGETFGEKLSPLPYPRWKGSFKIGLKKSKVSVFAKFKAFSGYGVYDELKEKTRNEERHLFGSYTDLDLSSEYAFSSNHKVILGVNNIIYDYPSMGAHRFATGLHDPVGRHAHVNYKYMF